MAFIATSRYQVLGLGISCMSPGGKNVAMTRPGAEPQNHVQILNAEALLLGFKRKERRILKKQKGDRF